MKSAYASHWEWFAIPRTVLRASSPAPAPPPPAPSSAATAVPFSSTGLVCAVISSQRSSRRAHVTFLARSPPPQGLSHRPHGSAAQWWYVHRSRPHARNRSGTAAEALYATQAASGTTRPAAPGASGREGRSVAAGSIARQWTPRRWTPKPPHVALHAPHSPDTHS